MKWLFRLCGRPDAPDDSPLDPSASLPAAGVPGDAAALGDPALPTPAPDTPSSPVAASSPEPAADTAPSKIPEYLKTLKSGLVLLLQKTEPFLEGTPFQIPISVINSFIDLANVVSDNKQGFEDLFKELSNHIAIVNDALGKATSTEAKERVQKLSEVLKEEMDVLDALLRRRTIRKILESDEDTGVIATTVKRIDGHLKQFQLDITMAIERKVDHLTLDSALSVLYQAASHDAAHNAGERFSSPRCHPETRKDMIASLRKWCSGGGQKASICWLHGPAGAGKSAIAQSLCEELTKDGRLGGSFFFKRGDPSRGRGTKLFPTISHQLTRLSPELKHAIGTRIGNDPAVVHDSHAVQLEKLIIEPCLDASHSPSRTVTIIIDGLDECDGENVQQEILRSIGRALQSQAPLRFLIASRPEPHIEKIFQREPSLTGYYATNVEQSFEDVRKYLLDEFERICGDHGSMRAVCSPWPTEEVVEDLVEKSSGYFIYATTVVKFLDDENFYPPDSLEIIMGKEADGESPLAPLDQLYTQILNTVPSRARPQLLRILSVIAAGDSLTFFKTVRSIGQLLQLNCRDIHSTLYRLHSLLIVPSEDDSAITVHHASFLDFLTSSARSTNYHFDDVQRHNLASDMLKAFSDQTPDGRLLPAIDHIAWELDVTFITSAHMSPNLIDRLYRVNLDFIFTAKNNLDGPIATADKILSWLKIQQTPENLLQQWKDYRLMAVFDSVCREISRDGIKRNQEIQQVLLQPSRQLILIVHAYRLLSAGRYFISLFDVRLVLGFSWEELRLAICSLPEMMQKDETVLGKFILSVAHPTRIRKLHPDPTLEDIAKRCLRLVQNFDQLPGHHHGGRSGPPHWSFILRSCPPSSDLLKELRQISRSQVTSPVDALEEVETDLHNIRQWLKTFTFLHRPVDLITRFEYDPSDKDDALNQFESYSPSDAARIRKEADHAFDQWEKETGWR
ncbi:hypothetical protein C8R43DRAFT_1022684 [Mycena crocata]|nr:hypothetical protein C8R43DRAFT_1022684 [Mycena crocata]